MMRYSVCFVTSTRADYGIMRPLIQQLFDTEQFTVSLVATGMHLCREFGNTWKEIEEDGFHIEKKIDIQVAGDTRTAMTKTMGMALIGFADYFLDNRPDVVFVLGDRYEIAAICPAALNQLIPIAHLHGGELTEGAVDNCYRHAITKMSTLHFASCEAYRKRIIQMGEQPDTVFNVGALGIESLLAHKDVPIAELSHRVGMGLSEKGYSVVTFHPETMREDGGSAHVLELAKAMDRFPDHKFVITKSNSDVGGGAINSIWEEYVARRNNCVLFASLGSKYYHAALSSASMIIGNSSSGIIEAPSFGIATVNVGDRQKGRIQAKSILNCLPEEDAVAGAMKQAMSHEFQIVSGNAENPYGNGHTSERIRDILLQEFEEKRVSAKKRFFDIGFECQ
jgi:GDP/UDP-N,N'-diacetylbacillosamine 2-epimerase (hydrolysing)